MNRAFRLFIAVLVVAAALLTFWMARRLARESTPSSSFGQSVQSAVSNPVEFAKNRITGGVGLMLRMDPAAGLPVVQGVGVGLPAEAAGLHAGDVILEVNGRSTTNMLLAQVVDIFRGFVANSVEVKVRRAGVTNLSFVIRRASMNSLLKTPFNQGAVTNK
jgi:C-terminal processing protease CtpA/Prc